jgi:hypothetical protein
MAHVTMVGSNSMVSSCLREYAVCDKGYYNMTSGAEDYGRCVSCLSVPPVNCGRGHYQKRCIERQDDTDDLNELCDICNNPALPDSVKYRYGLGRLYDECPPSSVLNPLLCAWFLTPKWNTGLCDVECNAGYVPVSWRDYSYAYPNCSKCETACSLGFKPPSCPGGSAVVGGKIGACEACADLPVNGRWVSGGLSCEWECAVRGFYKGVSSSCVRCEVLETCSGQGAGSSSSFMGCNGNSSGRCTTCPISGCQSTAIAGGGLTYLSFGIHLDMCTCVNCSMPQLGVSYAVKNCSTDSDAILAPCTPNPCLGLAVGSHYTARLCTLWNNSFCAACLGPPSPGSLLISECTQYADAVYGDCPAGMACNGTAVYFQCPDGKVAVGGVCECGPATVLLSGACVPIVCPRSGMYPDPDSGTCKNCTFASATFAISKEGVLGLDACGCPVGFFVQRFNSSIRCWPCGDLGCMRGLQRQSECLGFGQIEPTCDCAPAPGTELVDDTQDIESVCLLRCAQGYHQTSVSALLPGLYNKFSFLSNALPDTSEIVILSRSIRNIRDVVCVGDNIGVVLHDGGMLSLVRLDSGAVAQADLNILMGARARFELGVVTAIVGHEGMVGGYIWIAFTYWGYCGDIDSTLERNCSAIELVMLQASSGSAAVEGRFCVGGGVDICMALTPAIWGNLFPSSGTSGKIYSMALGLDGSSIFMALGEHGAAAADTLAQYTLTFYQESVPSSERSSDPLVVLGQYGGIVDVSCGAGRLYALVEGENKIFSFLLSEKTWDKPLDLLAKTNYISRDGQIVQLSENLLLIQVRGGDVIIIDTLNNLAATFYVSRANHEMSIDKVAFRANLLVGIMGGGASLAVYRSAAACPVDTVLYEDKSGDGCVLLPCVLSAPCGLHSVRRIGQTNCVCEPGYFSLSGYVSASSCIPCGQASPAVFDDFMYEFYCPGGLTAVRCPDHSTTSSYFATSVSECLCTPGYYHFGSYCLPCPTNMWCPGNGTMTPIPCHAHGTTLYEGSLTALDCICPARTYGLLCKPCADGDDCVFIGNPTPGLVSSPSVPTLTSVNVRGSGPIWGEEIATSCISIVMDIDNFLIYSIYGADASSLLVSSQPAPDILGWNWVFVFRDPASDAYENISACLGVHGFNVELFRSVGIPVPGSFLRFSSSCGIRNWEWSGLEESPCTCVAGYEARMTITWGIQCFPCIQGTVRRRRSTGGCVPCTGSNEHAPYLGMKECVCVEGFARQSEGGQCVDVRTYAPSWYSDLSSPTIVVTLTVVLGCVFVMGSVLAAFYLF